MLDVKVYEKRAAKFLDKIASGHFSEFNPLKAEFVYDGKAPIPYSQLGKLKSKFKDIKKDEPWGELWGSAWFRFEGVVPKAWKGKEVFACIDVEGEGAIWQNGTPVQGLTGARKSSLIQKRGYPLFKKAKGGESIELLVEAGANQLFGQHDNKGPFHLREAALVIFDRQRWNLEMDLLVMNDLFRKLAPNSNHRRKLLWAINETANAWDDGKGIEQCLHITKAALSKPANASELTAYSIGHAHIDLGWLWPTRETRRKGGRTFSTALQLMQEYPEYHFGASQPQLYQWVKEDYPELYQRIKQAVKKGQWECQGVMWVEPDTNVPSGESLVRQCFYGKRFYQKEFGVEVKNLWLPDVFGYSAALPQILKRSGVDVFMTQKISWNDTNLFPHHTFYWRGIDGTSILTHFLPMNTYNANNLPAELILGSENFGQSSYLDSFLNLYGAGDGGGGPSRKQIEISLRQQNLESVVKVKLAKAEDFFEEIRKIPEASLPSWQGELYLELHRATYTTQAKIKKYNRLLEGALHDVELLAALCDENHNEEIDAVWRDTLLNQFHDILPGSSITWVYQDAEAMSQKNLEKLQDLQNKLLKKLSGQTSKSETKASTKPTGMLLLNTQSWEREEIVTLPKEAAYGTSDNKGEIIKTQVLPNGEVLTKISIAPLAMSSLIWNSKLSKPTTVTLSTKNGKAGDFQANSGVTVSNRAIENSLLRIEIAKDGTLSSIFDKQLKKEFLKGPGNQLLIWEDEPVSWPAWDVNHFYRETKPEAATLVTSEVLYQGPLAGALRQSYSIGHSKIELTISLSQDDKLLKVAAKVDWNEQKKMLRMESQSALQCKEASYEIQFGLLKRATYVNTSWDRAMFEVCGHRFVDLSEEELGMALINDCKYGHLVRDGLISLNLLRSSQDPDPVADLGEQVMAWAFYPHAEVLEKSDVLQRAHNFNSQLLSIATSQEFKSQKAFIEVDGKSVKLDTVKMAHDKKGLILRLYETFGCKSSVTLRFGQQWKAIHECDLLENVEQKLSGKTSEIQLDFSPFALRTLWLEP